MENDVIAAIASPIGTGAVGVVRVSGKGAAEVLHKVFRSGRTRKTKKMPSHTLTHGYIVGEGEEIIDEVMCAVMYAPRSYTREDTAEIYTHGGLNAVQGVLRVLLQNGARPALPGEFSKRAFLNGRIDLSQAEAVMEIITAKTDLARRAGLRKLSGGLSRTLNGFRDRILQWIAHIELSIDYPEHGEEAMNLAEIHEQGMVLLEEMEALLSTANAGRYISAGVPAVIAGKPNVGKSSLMNAVLGRERAIVTAIPGTTRDTLTETVVRREVPLLLTDTAGIHETGDEVEQIGVKRSAEAAQSAELTLLVIDRSAPVTGEDIAVADMLRGQKCIVLLNKCDLPKPEGFNTAAIADILEDAPFIEISAKSGTGLDELYRVIEKMFIGGALSADADLINNARHEYLLARSAENLRAAMEAAGNGTTEDLIAIDLKAAYRAIGEILGQEAGDDVIDRIFSEFCVGK